MPIIDRKESVNVLQECIDLQLKKSKDYQSDNSWGGTRVSGQPAPWLLKAHHKNTKLFYERHKDLINNRRLVEHRELS